MSCNCGCHDDKPPAKGWRRYVPVLVGVGVLAALIAGAVLTSHEKGKSANDRDAKHASTAARP